jgi:hypothetical protein
VSLALMILNFIIHTAVDKHSARGKIFLLRSSIGASIGSVNILTYVSKAVRCKIIVYKLTP